MKKNYYSTLLILLICFATGSHATNHTITVTSTTCTPAFINASIGDSVSFVWGGATNDSIQIFQNLYPVGGENWLSGDSYISTVTTYKYKFLVAGNYSYLNLGPPGFSGSVLVQNTGGGTVISNVDSPTQFSCYPNPFENDVTFKYHDADWLSIYDLQGRLLKRIPLSASSESIYLDGSNLSKGFYLYRFEKLGTAVKTGEVVKK